MWIHHAVLLQFIIKNVNDHLHQVSIIHKNDNGDWNKFMKILNDASTVNCRKLVAWNGCNVMDKEFNEVVIEAAAEGVLTSEALFVSALIDADIVDCVESDIIHKIDNGNWNKFMMILDDASTQECKKTTASNICSVLDEEFNKAVSELAAKCVLSSEASFGSAPMDADDFIIFESGFLSDPSFRLDMDTIPSQITADDDTDFSSFDDVSIELGFNLINDDFSRECVVIRDVPVALDDEMQDVATRNDARTFVRSDSQGFHTIAEGSDGIGMFDDADANEDDATKDKACERNILEVVDKSPTQCDVHLKIKRCSKNGEDMMSVPSTRHDGQDGGGVYQTGRSANIASLIKIIEPIFEKLQQEFPSIKKNLS
jgi:hypothetical protein